jgi:ferritin-like metal-binding protein YciE
MKTLEDLFMDELQDMYDAEHRILKALPKLAKAATDEKLKAAFLKHLGETEQQVDKLEEVFQAFDEKPKAKKCKATVGLLEEGDEIASDNKGEPTLNAALISAGQKVEHYEMASYGCLLEWAGVLGNQKAAGLIGEILEQEKAANQTLNELARKSANQEAMGDENEADDEAPAKSSKNSSQRKRMAA